MLCVRDNGKGERETEMGHGGSANITNRVFSMYDIKLKHFKNIRVWKLSKNKGLTIKKRGRIQ